MKIGAITIGQAPREDVTCDVLPFLGEGVILLQAGGLDGLSKEEIAQFQPEQGDYVLISKLQDGTSVVFAEKYILPKLQSCIGRLEEQGAQLILFFCTGRFPDCFKSRVPLIFPYKLLNAVVPLLTPNSSIGVITPKPEQILQAGEKWEKLVRNVKVLAASPYGDPKELLQAAEQMRREPVELIVLDCIGYNAAMKKEVEALSGKPVVLSRTLLARIAGEMTGCGCQAENADREP